MSYTEVCIFTYYVWIITNAGVGFLLSTPCERWMVTVTSHFVCLHTSGSRHHMIDELPSDCITPLNNVLLPYPHPPPPSLLLNKLRGTCVAQSMTWPLVALNKTGTFTAVLLVPEFKHAFQIAHCSVTVDFWKLTHQVQRFEKLFYICHYGDGR